MAKRSCQDWLKTYLDFTINVESPTVFHVYSGLFALSAAAGRKIWIDRGAYKLYPNLYIILVAASALCRKTTAIEIAARVLRLAIPDLPIVASKISTEMLMSTLSKQFKMYGRSEAIMIAEELGVFLGSDIRNISLVELLTKLYNCGDYINQATIGRGNEVCQFGYGTMLAGTTPEWMHNAFPRKSTEGGFTGRCLFVYAKTPRQRKAEPSLDHNLLIDLATDLRGITELGGEAKVDELGVNQAGKFIMDQSGRDWYINWYENEFHPPSEDFRLDGYFGKKHDTVIKVAMLVSLAHKDELVLTSMELSRALELIERLEPDLVNAMRSIHTTDVGDNLLGLLRIIKMASPEGVSHSSLLRKVSYKMRAGEVKEHIDMMESSGMIEKKLVDNDGLGRKGFIYHIRVNKHEGEAEGSGS